MKILVSGFGVFGSHTENSSEYVVNRLKESNIPNLKTVILPVTFSGAFEVLQKEIESFQPDYVVSLGLAGNRQKIGLEKVAINLIHCDIPDNEGILQKDQLILTDGPAAYFSTLPLEKMREVQTPISMEMSLTAGTYVCNYLMYRLLDYTKNSNIKAGFIHLPPLNKNDDDLFYSVSIILENLPK